ncbi:multidrug resistance-associated protein 5 [Tanacetum coccineum]|uniref:Multidrug resistance-associated protein 5 n=1 Tax=Tanacetum coccineum TaxID=301880 RepID=A0ABQ5FGN5_9ASTR
MASSSCSTPIRINFHHGGVFEANPINYKFDMVSKLDNVNIYAMDYSAFVTYLETISHAMSNALYFVVLGLDLKNGLRSLKNDFGMRNLREYALKNDGEIDVYMAHSKFDFDDRIIEDNHHSGSDEDDYDIYDIYSTDEDDTASLDYLSDGEDEIVGVRTQKSEPKNKKIIPVMFDDTFLATIFKGLDKDKYVEKNVVLNDEMNPEDEDRLGELWHIHDPKTKWKLMRPVLGHLQDVVEMQMENQNALIECGHHGCKKERPFKVKSLVDEHCCSRTYEFVCKGQLLSALELECNNQVYPIAWAVVDVENKENWMWFMQCLIDDLGIAYGEGLTIISDQHKDIVEAAKEVMPMAEHRQCARHIYANFRKRFTGVLYRNLFWEAAKCTFTKKFEEVMQQIKSISGDAYKHSMDRNPQSWSRAFFTTDKAYDAVENGISECFNSLIVDARRKPIINMLEDIRTYIMERMKKMRDKHLEWKDEIWHNHASCDKRSATRTDGATNGSTDHTTTFTTIPSDKSMPSRATCRWDSNPGRHVTRDKLKGKALQGYFPERHRLPSHKPCIIRKIQVNIQLDRETNVYIRVSKIKGRRRQNEEFCGPSRQYPTNTGKCDNNDGPSVVNDDSNATITKSKSKDESGSKGGLRRTGGSTSSAGKGVTGTGGGARSKETGDAAMYYSGGSKPIEMGVSFAENDRSLMLGNSCGVPVPAWPAQTNPADLVHPALVEENQSMVLLLLVNADKYDSLIDEKMIKLVHELVTVGIAQTEVGKAAEFCY